MRVVGGRLGGRPLVSPRTRAIRPTSDRLRGSLFDILAHVYGEPREDSRALDLFAGVGALGIEALSRGARFALFVDQDAVACALIRGNLVSLDLAASARVLRRDARKPGGPPEQAFDLAFLDPPYGRGLATPALAALDAGGWLRPHALVVVEESVEVAVALPSGFELGETRRFGDTQLVFARAGGAGAAP